MGNMTMQVHGTIIWLIILTFVKTQGKRITYYWECMIKGLLPPDHRTFLHQSHPFWCYLLSFLLQHVECGMWVMYPVLSNGILELWKGGFRAKQGIQCSQRQDMRRTRGHVSMMSQITKEGGTGIYIRGFPGILWEVQLGITLSLPIIDEEETWIPNKITRVWAPYMARCSKH